MDSRSRDAFSPFVLNRESWFNVVYTVIVVARFGVCNLTKIPMIDLLHFPRLRYITLPSSRTIGTRAIQATQVQRIPTRVY
jgi:hypothetical protein